MKAKAKLRPGVLAAAAAALAFFPQEARAKRCIAGPFNVFFHWNDDALTAEARATLDTFLSTRGSCRRDSRIRIVGFADRSGPEGYNVSLAGRRADNVRSYLLERQIAPDEIDLEAAGEGRPSIETADGVREERNRRVEVQYVD